MDVQGSSIIRGALQLPSINTATPTTGYYSGVYPDKSGHYTVMLGSSTSSGLPVQLFADGEARWLGVQSQGQPEQARIYLLSVPYAMKAADAQTVGGLPASAFVLAAPGTNAASSMTSNSGSDSTAMAPNVAGTGTQNYVPLWIDSAGTLGNSVLYQSGSGSTARIGTNTTTPGARLGFWTRAKHLYADMPDRADISACDEIGLGKFFGLARLCHVYCDCDHIRDVNNDDNMHSRFVICCEGKRMIKKDGKYLYQTKARPRRTLLTRTRTE